MASKSKIRIVTEETEEEIRYLKEKLLFKEQVVAKLKEVEGTTKRKPRLTYYEKKGGKKE